VNSDAAKPPRRFTVPQFSPKGCKKTQECVTAIIQTANIKNWSQKKLNLQASVTHSRLTLRVAVTVFTLIYSCDYHTAQSQAVFTYDSSNINQKIRIFTTTVTVNCQQYCAQYGVCVCVCVCIFSTKITTVQSQKMPWLTDSYLTMLTDAMLSLDMLQYYPITNCTYFEGPLLYNSMTLHTISGPYIQFQGLTYNFRDIQQMCMLLIAPVENWESYGCVVICSGIIITVWLKSAQRFEILTRNAQPHRKKGGHKSWLLLNL